MSAAVHAYKAARYTAVAFYALEEAGAWEDDAPACVTPAEPVSFLSPDVAPYGTYDVMCALAAGVLAERDRARDPEARGTLERLLAWIDEVDAPWVCYQLEPPEIAGLGTADIEEDPDCPE